MKKCFHGVVMLKRRTITLRQVSIRKRKTYYLLLFSEIYPSRQVTRCQRSLYWNKKWIQQSSHTCLPAPHKEDVWHRDKTCLAARPVRPQAMQMPRWQMMMVNRPHKRRSSSPKWWRHLDLLAYGRWGSYISCWRAVTTHEYAGILLWISDNYNMR